MNTTEKFEYLVAPFSLKISISYNGILYYLSDFV